MAKKNTNGPNKIGPKAKAKAGISQGVVYNKIHEAAGSGEKGSRKAQRMVKEGKWLKVPSEDFTGSYFVTHSPTHPSYKGYPVGPDVTKKADRQYGKIVKKEIKRMKGKSW